MGTVGFYSLPAICGASESAPFVNRFQAKMMQKRCSLRSETGGRAFKRTPISIGGGMRCAVFETHEWRYLGMSGVRWNYESGESVAEQISAVQMHLRSL